MADPAGFRRLPRVRVVLGVALVVAVAAAALRPRRRRQARVAATWAAETDQL